MRIGKLTVRELKDSVIDVIGIKRSEVLASAGISKDCAAVKCDDIILLTTDPITASSHIAGKLAIIVASNDVAAGGGEPFCCLLTVIAPKEATAEDVKAVMTEAEKQAAAFNIDIVGGHTEFSPYVSRMVVSCTMLGRAKKIVGKELKSGASIVMTKYAGLEGTVILANDAAALSLNRKERAEADALEDSLSVLKEGAAAAALEISLMHDITEGGVLGAVYEMCLAAGKGADIYGEKIPILPITDKICRALKINPLKLISSGSMLVVTENPAELIDALAAENINAVKIGEINDTGAVRMFQGGGFETVNDSRDEICGFLN
ncbi:MAG: AIR synthase [Clostridiales bacterium]|jgi:hydrogenase expression/formation protein HypE|nr:AIR synthase [Clostridiales bacterium]